MKPIDVSSVNQTFEKKSPQELLQWAFEEFGDKIALASSFGVEDVALIDMMVKINRKARIFTLDTGRLNEETYEVMDRIRDKYGIPIESYFPDPQKVETLERTKGFYSFRKSIENRKECCGIRKVEPLGRALSTVEAWITGLRQAQSVTRADVAKVEVDVSHSNIIKVNPLADWSEKQVWDYVKQNQVPYNKLHDQGYPSIGCSPCTRAIKPGEELRAGRWWWENPEQKECGLHVHKSDDKGKQR